MTKLIFALVIIIGLGTVLTVTDVGQYLGPINEYIIKPISIIVAPITEIFKIIFSFNEIAIVLGIYIGCSLIVYVLNKVIE